MGTYKDPVTGAPFEYGVQSYIKYPGAEEFVNRLNISTFSPPPPPTRPASRNIDFVTGKALDNFVAPSNFTAALTAYLKQCERYENITLPGYWNFPTKDKIPSDLLLDFGDFVKKYNLEAIVPQISSVTSNGLGDITTKPTLFVMQSFPAPMARAFLGGPSTFVPTSRNNTEIYARIGSLLSGDVLYSTVAIRAERSANGVELLVRGKNGTTIVRAKRLLVAFEPVPDSMESLELDAKEWDVHTKWRYSNVFAGIVKHPSLPFNTTLVNLPTAAAPNNYLERPQTPFLWRFDYMGTPGWRILATGDESLTRDGLVDLVKENVNTLVKQGVLPTSNSSAKVDFVELADHGAMHLRVTSKDLRDGFIQALYALQGYRSTWYTGSAWTAQYSSIVWAFTDTLLPRLVQGL